MSSTSKKPRKAGKAKEGRRTKPQKPAKPDTKNNVLRDTVIMAGALAGKPMTTIAEELGIHRETVARVLKSDKVRAISERINFELLAGVDKSVANVLGEIEKGSYSASLDLLRNFGVFGSSARLELTGKDGERFGKMSDEELQAQARAIAQKILEVKS